MDFNYGTQSSYGLHRQQASEQSVTSAIIASLACGVYVLYNLVFHSASLAVAFNHLNSTCYENSYIMSLSSWIRVNSFSTLFTLGIFLCMCTEHKYGIVANSGEYFEYLINESTCFGWIGSCGLFAQRICRKITESNRLVSVSKVFFVLAVIIYSGLIVLFGLIELGIQFEPCLTTDRALSIMSMMGILNTIFLLIAISITIVFGSRS